MSPCNINVFNRGLILSERSESKDLINKILRLLPIKQVVAQDEWSEKHRPLKK